jgi:C4-dicarboxylate-binding protein DctP
VQVFPNSQLFGDGKEMEALALGDVQIIAPSLSKFAKYTPEAARSLTCPSCLTTSKPWTASRASKEGQDMLNSMTSKGIVGLGYLHNGMKQLSSNKAMPTPADAKGLKFRIQPSDVLEAQFKAVGANPQKACFCRGVPSAANWRGGWSPKTPGPTSTPRSSMKCKSTS